MASRLNVAPSSASEIVQKASSTGLTVPSRRKRP
ncbi:MAG TPA: hypothetical protein DER26_05305 [Verrucomicrobia bacterium]|nr:hypothetical protein [Verrucomicrobiota bacterium]